MEKQLQDVEFVIFDTETTGLEPQSGDRVIEIAALRFKGNERLGVFHSLLNPQRQISPAAFAVNKISQEMLRDAPFISEAAPKFLAFIQGAVLCSYNAPFDMGFLENELRLIGHLPPEDLSVVDVLKMARKLLPNLERHALWFVVQSLGITIAQEHRALSDVELTFKVFTHFCDRLQAKGVFDLGYLYSPFFY